MALLSLTPDEWTAVALSLRIAVVATVPLSEMFGYIGQLRSMTSRRASFTMEFSHYDPVPKNVADEVIAEVAKRRAALNA